MSDEMSESPPKVDETDNLEPTAATPVHDGYKIRGRISNQDGTAIYGRNTFQADQGNENTLTSGIVGEAELYQTGILGIAGDPAELERVESTTGLHGAASGTTEDAPIGVLGTAEGGAEFQNAGVLGIGDPAVAAINSDQSAGSLALNSAGLSVLQRNNDGSQTDPSSHAVWVSNETDGTGVGVAITMPNQGTEPDGTTNFVTFRSNNSPTGAIEGNGSGGVTLDTGGSDYAEYLPVKDAQQNFEPGDVVGINAGEIMYETETAQQVMVITGQPAVTGNSPGQDQNTRAEYERVAFVGQVPVKIREEVAEGNLVVPSGEEDGTALALSPTDWQGDRPVIGQAWESDTTSAVTRVTVAVGINDPSTAGRLLQQKDDRIEAVETENEQLRERLSAVEDRLAAIEQGAESTPVADD